MKSKIRIQNFRNVFFAAILLSQFHFAGAQSLKIFADKSKTSITYAMKHPLHEWEGTSKEVNSVILYDKTTSQISSVAVAAKVSSFDSQNANRDSHMIEAVEGIKFPQVTFNSTSVNTNGSELTVEGDLVFHGISKKISFSVKLKQNKSELIAEGAFEVKMSDHKIDKPTLMAIPSDDLIKIRFTAVYLIP